MVEIPREQGELEAKLLIQRKALASSASAYDNGELWEAERLAVTVSNLVNDGGGRSKSLLSQLGLLTRMEFLSSSRGMRNEHLGSPVSPKTYIVPPTPLLSLRFDNDGVSFAPLCESEGKQSHYRYLKFKRWYRETIFETVDGRRLNRKNLVYVLRSQDGGAHIDSLIRNEAYSRFRVDTDPRMSCGGKPIPNAHYATMRQVAWELEQSLIAVIGSV